MSDMPNSVAPAESGEEKKSLNFVEQIVEGDLRAGKNDGRIQTRFPPEPNGYLHIGHAKAICMDFGIAESYGGVCNLRFDDTNPTKEDVEYVDAIREDIEWLGFHWGNIYYASDYFERLYQFAEELIRAGHATSMSRLPKRSQRRRVRLPPLVSPAPIAIVPSRRASISSVA